MMVLNIEKIEMKQDKIFQDMDIEDIQQYIDNFAKKNNVEKILFLSRDCYLLSEIYKKYFNTIDNQYFMSSRYALCKINVQYNIELFIAQNIVRLKIL